MNETGLLPCPFCGSDDAYIFYCEKGCCEAKPVSVSCDCGCELTGYWNTKEEAVTAWNSRSGKWTKEMIDTAECRAEKLYERLAGKKFSETSLSQSIIDKLASLGFTEIGELCCPQDEATVKGILTVEEWEEFDRIGRSTFKETEQ